MKRSEAFPSKYLNKDDIHAPTLGTIERVTNETLGQGDDQEIKPVMYFSAGIVKPMVVNNTNWMNVEAVYGDESDNWIGKQIEVWVDPSVAFGGKRIGGLRLRAPSIRVPNGGVAAAEMLTMQQAKDTLAAAGVDYETFKAALKEEVGLNADGKLVYEPARDTQLVRRLLAQNAQPAELA